MRRGAQHQVVREVAQQHVVLADPAHGLLVAVRTFALVRAVEPQPRHPRAHIGPALDPVAAAATVVVVVAVAVVVAIVVTVIAVCLRAFVLAALLAALLVALRQALQSLPLLARPAARSLPVALLEPRELRRRAGVVPAAAPPSRADGLLVLLLALLQQRLGLRREVLPWLG
eukprot:scaffold42908_cov55-Phaeocystis_antarctica.AAC.2